MEFSLIAVVGTALEVDSAGVFCGNEIADILIFGLLFCHEADINPQDAVRRKLDKNRRQYPVQKARGRSAKYTELDEG